MPSATIATPPPERTGSPASPFAPLDYALYAATVGAWSLSWYALDVQVAVGTVTVEWSLAWRFAIATVLMFAWVLARGDRMRFSARTHVVFALMGVCIFSMNFNLFYYASAYLASGLLSVVFSLASVFNFVIAFALTRERPGGGVLLGAVLGFVGIAMLFAPTLAAGGGAFDAGAAFGLALCVAGTLLFCTGNQLSARLQRAKVPVIPASAWGMLYGTLASMALAVAREQAPTFDWRAPFLVSLAWLAVVSTVVAFASYLTLVGRIGAGRASYATVIFPVFALIVSTMLEGYEWHWPAVLGLFLVLAGNMFVIRGR